MQLFEHRSSRVNLEGKSIDRRSAKVPGQTMSGGAALDDFVEKKG
jgi:hypothetical protein